MSTRREFLCNGTVFVALGNFPCICLPMAARLRGCILPTYEATALLKNSSDQRLYVTGNEPIVPRSGNKKFDRALAQTLAKLSSSLDVKPGFAYYDDASDLNAYATKEARLKNVDGTVLFGLGLLKRLLNGKESPDVAVAAVCAHEFGHILQFKHGLDAEVGANQRTVKRIELQADFFAGYFAGLRKLDKPDFPAAVFALTQYNAGDDNVDSEGHHGTHQERGDAVSRGFQVAFGERRPISEAIDISTRYVKSIR